MQDRFWIVARVQHFTYAIQIIKLLWRETDWHSSQDSVKIHAHSTVQEMQKSMISRLYGKEMWTFQPSSTRSKMLSPKWNFASFVYEDIV